MKRQVCTIEFRFNIGSNFNIELFSEFELLSIIEHILNMIVIEFISNHAIVLFLELLITLYPGGITYSPVHPYRTFFRVWSGHLDPIQNIISVSDKLI